MCAVIILFASSNLQANLIIQETRLETAMAELGEAQALLDDKQAELDLVQANYEKAMKEKQTLMEAADECRRKMTNASALIDGLAGTRRGHSYSACNRVDNFHLGLEIFTYYVDNYSALAASILFCGNSCQLYFNAQL